MKKYLLAPALAALAMFVFGAAFWMSPLPYTTLTPSPDDRAAAAALARAFPATGTYMIPGPHLDHATIEELYRAGPSALVHFVREGQDGMQPIVFVKGYIHCFIIALLLTILLSRMQPALKCYFCTIRLCAMIGLLGGLLLECMYPIWWNHTWGLHLMNLLYAVLAFAVAGLVLGKFLKPTAAAPQA